MFLSFPDFNIYSTPLLILVVQGLVFVGLLFARYIKKKNISDLFLALILLIVCYQQTCYTVGFMGWYNVFRNTKINYFLIPLGIAIAPLIYFYVKAITTSNFTFKKKDFIHFIPAITLILYRFSIYFYDSLQPGFNDTQNGILKLSVDEPIVLPLLVFVSFAQMLLYLAFTFQLFYNYRKRIKAYFSNTYKLELNWILSFLIAFTALFLYSSLQDIIGSLIIELNYEQRWWLNIFMAIVVLFVGIKGYFTDTTKLNKLSFSFSPNPESIPQVKKEEEKVSAEDIEKLKSYMELEKPYLNPDLNLSDLSDELQINRAELSKIINSGFNKNFNDFINEYRVNTFKEKLNLGEHKQLSLLGIAYDCGFNSKATFNRVFKKITQISPTEFLNSITK
uniref:helix-turn-helix domain-containing protein n=1 Tax=uncultured Polaribacter sp. TaxID=174711 RepID=UPI002620CAC5|nr:helix-turn-helix domain-containing protein [uncultured Polaribacter sp.]